MSTATVAEILIRRAEPEDFLGLKRISEQPRAVWGTLQMPYPSAQVWRKRLEEHTGNHYALVACVAEELVGSLSLVVPERSPRRWHVGQIGMVVHDRWHGRGIGTALLGAAVELADRWLNLRRLELTVFVDNARAIRLYEKFGFGIEGTFKRYSFRDGAFVDAHAMARLR